jgi:P27 family predicted phage terminase small subunit
MTNAPPKPPKHLAKTSQTLWVKILALYDFDDAELVLLAVGLEALDRCTEARERLAVDGLTVLDRYGTAKAHPLCAIERDSRTSLARIWKQLGLKTEDLDSKKKVGRPCGS